MFRIRGLNGEKLFETDFENKNKESIFDTYQDAKNALENLEQSLPKDHFKIIATNCQRCDNESDVMIIQVNDEPRAFCADCRVEVFAKKKTVGRPSLGITKKVSVTLDQSDWDWLDEKAKGNRSAFIREVLWRSLGNESEWSNNACLGYLIKGLENLNYNHNEIKKIVNAVSNTFDMTSVPEAKNIYTKSNY